ncbi:DUF4185 domain-containing protein [Sphingomonas sp. CL5.1]|uniref:DUF4185 domain-containing protein n=1 Tax=Sphingomonas sp. CL5.1 TaxID=2653203 RepID=UPI00158216C6|nr:DUF4185 domain-containing protein [Sphingomonas sp. CL5.1]QKS01178.1 DUF4185 domain-containing protein [Sphingomonas sp. CL5.1]
MHTRRDFMTGTLALGASGLQWAGAAPLLAAPPARGESVRGMVRRDETILRLGGIGDGYQLTWGKDGRQYVVVNDGPGWLASPTAFYNSRLWTVSGSPHEAAFHDVAAYPVLDSSTRPDDAPQYYGHGILSVGGRIYQFLNTLDRSETRPRHWTGSKLIYSDDGGLTWRNQDGSQPVRWEDWADQSRARFAFFDEPGGCFALISILQMGRDYSANRDGYIYVYGLNGSVDGRMNEVVMFRAAIDGILDRRRYEYFGGWDGRDPKWVADIDARAVVHRFPHGWVNRTNLFPGDLVVESWLPSVVYNEPLDLYMMVSAGIGCGPDGTEFGKASYFGCWVAERPWGPWTQVHEEPAWTPGGDRAARAYAPQIAPGWIAPDGKSFWMVWADLAGMLTFARDEPKLTAALAKAKSPAEHSMIQAGFLGRYMPRYAFNAQRVDLVLR